nr:hypothetical protein [uncultured bacterium]
MGLHDPMQRRHGRLCIFCSGRYSPGRSLSSRLLANQPPIYTLTS